MSGETCWRHADLHMLIRHIWRNSLENLYWLIWYIPYLYMLFFRFDASTKKLFASFDYQVLFFGMAAMAVQVIIANIQYLWLFLDIQIKYSWKAIISLLKYCTLHETHFALQYWQPYFFHDYSYQAYFYFSYLLAVKYVNFVTKSIYSI